MSPLLSLDPVYPAMNVSSDRPAVPRVAVIAASSGTLQLQGSVSAESCLPALQHREEHLRFPLLHERLLDAEDPALNIEAQRSASKVTHVERE